ncbi:hypothetical protein [Xenorhabdus hominickii]|uniref:Uncharacterized protein n=1 Tax=Xenorhabdus hominickii TaxID=351679 RepID=A0A2G0QAY0_XENHO|nr:hypothetical protein [Xenorhabdus hominickii]PHM56319.1 hypothetical protein Xhom_01805 [Xenorhabdus hominickii]
MSNVFVLVMVVLTIIIAALFLYHHDAEIARWLEKFAQHLLQQ